MGKIIKIGIIGIGTVGSGVLNIIKENKECILKRSGIDINISKLCDLELKNKKDLISGFKTTTDCNEIIEDPEIHVVIELIGGYTSAKEIILKSLKNKKVIITANKALLALHGTDIFSTAHSNRVEIGFEAAVAGTIPILRSLKTGLIANKVHSIHGILNGTTNYILTKMTDEGIFYKEALKNAQELGFAEANPTFDVEGTDAAHKLTLLSWLAFDKKIDFNQVSSEGITDITPIDINYAGDMGYVIKLLGIAKDTSDGVECRVHPTMISKNHILASVKNEMNAVFIGSNYSGQTTYIGKGAGSFPTATSIISDVIYYGNRIDDSTKELELPEIYKTAHVKPSSEIISRFYFRFSAKDSPGVLAQITRILGNNNISISHVNQRVKGVEPVDVIVVTHPAKEGDVKDAIVKIDKLSGILQKTVIIRVED
jgi:homoserine dehydrogenase